MAFFTRQDIGRVYVIKIILPGGTVVHKIGMTNSNRSTDRMMEILRSWFTQYRYVPYSELKLDMKCHNPRLLEKYIHKVLEENRFDPEHKVDGGTEMFTGVNEIRIVQFLKAYNNSMYTEPPKLDKEGIAAVNQLLTG